MPGPVGAAEVPGLDREGAGARRWPALVALFGILLAVCVPVVALHVDRNEALSVLDEFAYADYLQKVHGGQLVVRHGEVIGQETLRVLACRGFNPPTWLDRPACDSPSFAPGDFPNAGVNSADIHPPTYFLVTAAGARVILGLGLTDHLVTAGRWFGAVWMAAGLLALWCLVRALDANRWAAGFGLALVAASPFLLREWHYLTPDAANILVGSLVALAALRWERRGRGLALLAGAGAAAMAVKAPNMMVVMAVAGYLVLRAYRGGTYPRRSYLRAAMVLVGGAAATSAAWLVVRAAVAVPGGFSPKDADEAVSGLSVTSITDNLARFVSVWDHPGSQTYTLALLASYLLVGSLLVALVALKRDEPRQGLALAVGVLMIVGPLLIVAANYLLQGSYAPVEPRYGASLVPLQCAIAASFWRSRASLVPTGALAVALPVAVLLVVLGI